MEIKDRRLTTPRRASPRRRLFVRRRRQSLAALRAGEITTAVI